MKIFRLYTTYLNCIFTRTSHQWIEPENGFEIKKINLLTFYLFIGQVKSVESTDEKRNKKLKLKIKKIRTIKTLFFSQKRTCVFIRVFQTVREEKNA